MIYKEAVAWLKGERSMVNTIGSDWTSNAHAALMTAQADAAMTQQAYWIVKAHRDRLVITDGGGMKPRHLNDDEAEYSDE
jgi:hypothetical protein